MSSAPMFDDEIQALREKLSVANQELAQLDEQHARATDQRDRIQAALDALEGPSQTEPVVRNHAGKYKSLWSWLTRQDQDVIEITFERIEEILGFPLPPSSRRHLAHWYGYDNSAVARAIKDAGFKASRANLEQETVEFHRQ